MIFSSVLAVLLLSYNGTAQQQDPFPSWNDGATKQAIVDFVTAVTAEGTASYVEPADRMATFENDCTLTLYIQKESPAAMYSNNWLPAPEGDFYMILRMYDPSEEAIKGEVVMPAVTKIN